MSFKKKLLLFFLISPTIFFNYLTLTLIDHDQNLSSFSIIIILSLNFINLFLAYIYFRYNFKVLFSFSIYIIIIILIFDFSLEKIMNKKSIVIEDDELGWTIKPNVDVNFSQETIKRNKYNVEYKSSSMRDFREFGNIESKNQKIIVIGDSATGGPYASNDKMYYSIIKEIFDKNNLNLEWFVMGTGGYGTVQHYILLTKYFEMIKPNIILHQFCVNDFFDNSAEISRLSTSHNQYYRRPYFDFDRGKISKVNNFFAKIYRILYEYSFIFKKFDQIYEFKQFRNFGRFKKDIPKELISQSLKDTEILFFKIRKLIGENVLYFSTNCADDTYFDLTDEWEEIIKNINGIAIVKPGKHLVKLKKEGLDVYHEDGGHLNEDGNRIYGELTADKMIEIIKNEKY